MLEGQKPAGFDGFLNQLYDAACEVGGFPVFLRTGHGSGKHDWRRTCYLTGPEDFASHVTALVEWSELVDFMGLPMHVWAVRSFLPLPAPFVAFRGMPVAPEWRCFVRDGSMVCRHFYWPASALAEGYHETPLPAAWGELLAGMAQVTDAEADQMKELAEAAARVLPGAWSIDLCRDRTGKLWITDCADAARSYHWPDCPQVEALIP